MRKRGLGEENVTEEVEQVDEKAPPGAKYERMVKHIKKGYAKGGLTDKEKSIAYATAWKAYKKNEETETEGEQIEEKYMGFKAVMAAAKKGGARDPAAVAAAIGRKKYGKEKFQAMAAAGKKANEEVEQIDEISKQTLGSYVNKAASAVAHSARSSGLEHGPRTPGRYNQIQKYENKVDKRRQGISKAVEKLAKEETEGSVPTTPKEKALAAHHGDKTKITYGDVIKARLKSAAAKKMGE
jgi:hypothetical protein